MKLKQSSTCAPAGQCGDKLIVHLLVEIQAGLVAAENFDLELDAVEFDRHRPFEFAGQDAVGIRQPFKLARGGFVALDDGARGEDGLQRGEDHRLALVHAERGGLDDEDVFVFVHDEAAEEIALGVDDPEGGSVGQMSLPDRERRADAPFEECLVHLDPVRREDADVDPGPGIVEAGAEKALAMVFNLDELAVGGGLGEAQDGAVVNPGVPRHDAVGFARFEEDGWQWLHGLQTVAPVARPAPT